MKLADELRARGFVYQFSSEKLEEITDPPEDAKRTFYLGVDPTADSIHAGNLAAYMLLRHLAEAGHRIILLVGGGTGMIGDPKPDVERPLEAAEVVAQRAAKLESQASKLLGGIRFEVVNNADWLGELNLIDFLRDIGKHFTVNSLMKKDAIAKRLASEEGITYTEFAYPLLQGYDFWHLFREKGCDVQVSGSDQWGNIMAGVDLIRRKEGKTAYALTIPLITDAAGKKFGKSEGNAVWLDPLMTPPYQFYQFWLNADDERVGAYLKLFTLLPLSKLEEIMRQHAADPGARLAQRTLASEVTALVHGPQEAERAGRISEILFGEGSLDALDSEAREMLKLSAPVCAVSAGTGIADALVASGLASSKREARQFLADGAVLLNGSKVDGSYALSADAFQSGLALLKRGKRAVRVLSLV